MCIFCQMVSGEIPVKPVFENEDVFVFLDNNPVNPGHCLVIPKSHYENIEDTPVEVLGEIVLAIKNVGWKIKNLLGYEGYNVVVNNGEVAGQEVMHSHWHVLPRLNENEVVWPEHKAYQEGEREEIYKKLSS